jgi:hypothetical protein
MYYIVIIIIIVVVVVVVVSTNVLDSLKMLPTSSEPNWLYHGTE